MKKFFLLNAVSIAFVLALAACKGQTAATIPPVPTDSAATAATVTTAPTQTAAVTATEAPTAAVTPTLADVKLTVISAQYCLKNPNLGSIGVGHFETGTVLTALGRDKNTEFFYVDNPAVAGGHCWIWTNYVLINGIAYDLPVIDTTK